MPPFNDDRFRWLERVTNEKGGASVDEIAKIFGISKKTTMVWLCRWENYYNEPRDIVQHFVVRVPGSPSVYKIGPDWWGERYNRGTGEAWHDKHDVEGLNPLHVSLGFVKTRTDSVTGKRTLKGIRHTNAYLKWINDSGGVTSTAFARKFELSQKSASTMLSRWKKEEKVQLKDRTWTITGQEPKDIEVVLSVVGHLDEGGKRTVSDEWQTVKRDSTE